MVGNATRCDIYGNHEELGIEERTWMISRLSRKLRTRRSAKLRQRMKSRWRGFVVNRPCYCQYITHPSIFNMPSNGINIHPVKRTTPDVFYPMHCSHFTNPIVVFSRSSVAKASLFIIVRFFLPPFRILGFYRSDGNLLEENGGLVR